MVTPIESDGKERLQAEFDTTIMLPDTGVIDAPHLSMVWGAFDANVFWSNRERLLTLRNDSSLTPNDRELLQTLSDKALRPYLTFLQRTAEWTEVKRNIASSLGIQDQTQYGRSLTSADFFHLFEQKM